MAGKLAGGLLRGSGTLLRFLQLCCAAGILGIFSYFIAVLVKEGAGVATWIQAIEGIAGAATLYALFAVVLTVFLGGVTFFAFLAIVLDILFIGAFIAVAVLTKGGLTDCSTIKTEPPLGNGNLGFGSNPTISYAPKLSRACNEEKAAFILAVIACVLFLFSALLQLLLGKHTRNQKRDEYATSGRTSRWRRNKTVNTIPAATYPETSSYNHGRGHNEGNVGTSGIRPTSNDTAMTGSTMAAPGAAYGGSKRSTFDSDNSGFNDSRGVVTGPPHTYHSPTYIQDGVVQERNGHAVLAHGRVVGEA